MAELSNGGSGTGAVTVSASTAPAASSSVRSRDCRGRSLDRIAERCSSTDLMTLRLSRLLGLHELLEPRQEVLAEVVPFHSELNDGAQIVELVAGVVATAPEQHSVHATALLGRHRGQGAQRVGQLDLPATARLRLLQHVEDGRVEHVTADDDPVAGLLARRRLLDQVADPGHVRDTA